MTRRRGLGSGLGGLISTPTELAPAGLREIPIDAVIPNPHQPRSHFDESALDELAASIREHGLLQPLVVTQLAGGDYQLIAGERRWRAVRRAGLSTVPVVVKEATPQQQLELAIIENIQRADLDLIEEARAYRALADEFGLTHEQIAQRLGKSRPQVTQILGLLRLPESIQQLVSTGVISLGHVRPLLTLDNSATQERAATSIVQQGMNARQAEAFVARLRDAQPAVEHSASLNGSSPEDDAVVDTLQRALGVRVVLKRSGRKGQLVLFWEDEEMLDGLYQQLVGP
jgi:ParB family transcriptional regulator, chromosome partitioning protein